MSNIDELKQIIAQREAELAESKSQINQLLTQVGGLTKQIEILGGKITSLQKSNDEHNLNDNAKRRCPDNVASQFDSNGNKSTAMSGIESEGNGSNDPNVIRAPTFAEIASTSNKTTKPMPIQLANYDRAQINQIIEQLATFCSPTDYQIIQYKTGAPCKIYTESMEIKYKISEWLQQNNVEYCSFKESAAKRYAFILRGLNFGNESRNIQLIKSSISTAGITSEFTVCRHLTPHMKRASDPIVVPLTFYTKSHFQRIPTRNCLIISKVLEICV